MNHLFLVNIVKGLEVDPLVSYIEKSINLYKRQYPLDSKLSWEKTFLWEILYLAKVESYASLTVKALAGRVAARIKLVCEVRKYIFYLNLITKGIFRLESLHEERKRLVERVKLIELDIDV